MTLLQEVTPAPTKPFVAPAVIDAMDELNSGVSMDEAPMPQDADILALKLPEPKAGSIRQITLPVSGGTAIIKIPYPVSPQSFDRLVKMLELWRDELVEKKAD